jgi:hypothetical protein
VLVNLLKAGVIIVLLSSISNSITITPLIFAVLAMNKAMEVHVWTRENGEKSLCLHYEFTDSAYTTSPSTFLNQLQVVTKKQKTLEYKYFQGQPSTVLLPPHSIRNNQKHPISKKLGVPQG